MGLLFFVNYLFLSVKKSRRVFISFQCTCIENLGNRGNFSIIFHHLKAIKSITNQENREAYPDHKVGEERAWQRQLSSPIFLHTKQAVMLNKFSETVNVFLYIFCFNQKHNNRIVPYHECHISKELKYFLIFMEFKLPIQHHNSSPPILNTADAKLWNEDKIIA